MFWGLIMEPQRRYTQTVKKAFHISMAALDISNADNEPTQIMCTLESRNYLLCTLQKGNIVQCALDLNFEVGEQVSFATNGNSNVHLTGYLTDDFGDVEEEEDDAEEEVEIDVPKSKKRASKSLNGPAGKKFKTAEMLEAINSQDSDDSDDMNFSDVVREMGEEEEDDDDEDDNAEEEEDSDNDGEEEESEEDDDGSAEEDEDDEEDEKPVTKKEKVVNGTPAKGKAAAAQAKQQAKKEQESVVSPKAEKGKTPKKNQQQEQKQDGKNAKSPKEGQQQSKKRTVEGGVIVEDLKQGEGPIAKPGKICQVYYEGRLKSNNKVFDSTNKGPGFKFRLGKQEVIKGWDVGLNGMKVGGKRRITCPANMAYGQKGSPPAIPPNATLVFEVELKGVS